MSAPRVPSEAVQQSRRRFWRLTCWLYIFLGTVSLGSGLFLAFVFPALSGRSFSQSDPLLFVLAGVLGLFGLIRIGSAGYHLRRLQRPRP